MANSLSKMGTWDFEDHRWINLGRLDRSVQSNGSIILMLSAQVCAVILSTTGRILRTGHEALGNNAMGTSEILFFMIMISMVCTWFYIYLAKIPDAPFGPANARKLLVIRGVAGFFGIWGFYFSLRYLDLAEATIINFVAPVFANIAIHIVTGRRGSPIQLIAGVICVLGVVLVLEPWNVHLRNSASEHVTAIAMALIGVLGGAGSYVAISLLEENAHPVLTVAYFTTISAALNGLVMILQRQESFHLPSTSSQWLLVVSMGVLHFAMHYLSAASLTWEGCSGRALNVVYTQIVFSVLADKLVWHVNPDAWKYVGAFLVLSNAIFIAMGKPS